MKVNSISAYSVGQNKKPNPQEKNIAFGKIVAQVAKDSYDRQVKKGLNLFMDYMRTLAKSAQQGDRTSIKKLSGLIGRGATQEIIDDARSYTNKTKQITKALPIGGYGTRGAKIRNMITRALGLPDTNKADLVLPAVIGTHKGKDIYLTTANNELLHMMQAKVLSPFEKIDWYSTPISEGDATIFVRGVEKNKLSKRKPVLFSYTDDVGTRGDLDYSELMKKYKELGGAKTSIRAISRGFMALKEQAEGKLGVFFPKNGAFEVVEKPSKEVLAKYPGKKVPTNIGKTLITPAGLLEIQIRRLLNPISLTKMENYGARTWHVTEGILKPAAKNDALIVIKKNGKFADIGNGTDFTDTLVSIAKGDFKGAFPKKIEKQLQKNVKLSEDGLTATLNYNGKLVNIPTSKAEKNMPEVQVFKNCL